MVSFDSDHSGGDGASPLFFSRSVYVSSPLVLFLGGVWEEFFLATLLISGVVDLPCEVP